MKLTMLLCDHVAAAEGKLYVNGAGWTMIGPEPSPSGIAVLIEVPWDQTNRQIKFRLGLRHEDGGEVMQQGPAGSQPLVVEGEVEVGRPADVPDGSPIPVPLAINLPPFALPPGQGYYWAAEVDGETREEWRLSFRVRPAPIAPTASSDPGNIPQF